MRNITVFLTLIFFLCLSIFGCRRIDARDTPISQQLYSFSPLAQIYLDNLGLTDKNNNGTIDKGAGEGYEEFIAKYGNADVGFYANEILYGANNGKLEEPEIVNHYYIYIRFKPGFEKETAAIENEVASYVYAHNLPLVWLDDQHGTVMNAVNEALGEGWNEQTVTEDEAVEMFNRTMQIIGIKYRPGQAENYGGYYTLPELVNRKAGYCFEVAQFGFWFFSQLRINSMSATGSLAALLKHEVVKLESGRIVDYFNTGAQYRLPADIWLADNAINSISVYYTALLSTANANLETFIIYNKYNLPNFAFLMQRKLKIKDPDYTDIIAIGEFILQNIDIHNIVNAKNLQAAHIREYLENTLLFLIKSYSMTNNREGFEKTEKLLQQHFKLQEPAKEYIEFYRDF